MATGKLDENAERRWPNSRSFSILLSKEQSVMP